MFKLQLVQNILSLKNHQNMYDKMQPKMKKNPNRILGTLSITIIPLFILDDSKNLLFANNTYYVVTDLFHVIFFYDRTNMYEIWIKLSFHRYIFFSVQKLLRNKLKAKSSTSLCDRVPNHVIVKKVNCENQIWQLFIILSLYWIMDWNLYFWNFKKNMTQSINADALIFNWN